MSKFDFSGVTIAYAVTGSFCTHASALEQMRILRESGALIIPILSENTQNINTRFGTAREFAEKVTEIAGAEPLRTIDGAEPLGPRKMCDIIVVAPCTGNTIAKLANSITDGVVTMAVKSVLRAQKPVLLAPATNDALAGSAKNIGALLNTRHYFFVPLSQDDIHNKPASTVADFTKIPQSVSDALEGKQTQPLYIC